jgi:hypothetical protein
MDGWTRTWNPHALLQMQLRLVSPRGRTSETLPGMSFGQMEQPKLADRVPSVRTQMEFPEGKSFALPFLRFKMLECAAEEECLHAMRL